MVRARGIDWRVAHALSEMHRASESGEAVGCDRGRLEPQLAEVFGDSATSFAWAPVRIGGQLYGVVTATSDKQLFEWPALRLLEGGAGLAGRAIGKAGRLRMGLGRTTELQAHADRMAEREKVKADFLKVASHELRGPLAILKGYVSMLSDGSLALDSPATAKVFTVVTAKLYEVSELVEQMLETARLEDSRLQLHLERQELTGLPAAATERVRPLARANPRPEHTSHPATAHLRPTPARPVSVAPAATAMATSAMAAAPNTASRPSRLCSGMRAPCVKRLTAATPGSRSRPRG